MFFFAEGWFHPTKLICNTEDRQTIQVLTELKRFDGLFVRFAAHHLPVDPTQPRNGCCSWVSSEVCPAGHSTDPALLYNVSVDGYFQLNSDIGSIIEQPNGQVLPLRLEDNLCGHHARIAVALMSTVEDMVDRVNSYEAMSQRINNAHDLLTQMKQTIGGR